MNVNKFLILLLTLALACPAMAATYTVDDTGGADYTTIQAAINAANNGDSVYVYPGEYHEAVLMKNGVNLFGYSPRNTTIDGDGTALHVVTYNGTDPATLSGFRITGSERSAPSGGWHYGGVYCQNGPITIRNNIIDNNHAGISVESDARPTIVNNNILHNHNGIIVWPSAEPNPRYSVAYIYNNNVNLKDAYMTFFKNHRISAHAYRDNEVTLDDLKDHRLIIIAHDADELPSSTANAIYASGRRVLGISRGGGKYFDLLNLEIGWLDSWVGSAHQIYAYNTLHPVFNEPIDIPIPKTRILTLYSTEVYYISVNHPDDPPLIDRIARQSDNETHYPIAKETDRYMIWGFGGSPALLTDDGDDLLYNAIRHMIETFDPIPINQEILNNIIAMNNQDGFFYYHWLNDGRIEYNDTWGNGKNYHNNEDGSTEFVPTPGTGEIHEDPMFEDEIDYYLAEGSPCIDAGHPGAEYLDPDGTRNDMGVWGGPAAGGQGGFDGSGFIFTAIGNIPTSEIVQTGSQLGLADVDSVTAADLHIPAYSNTPFGASLWIYGLFGDADDVDYYQIMVGKWNGNTPPAEEDYVPLTDSLTKVRYLPQPDGTVLHENVALGPQTVWGVENVYKLTREGYWSHIDLRHVWNTRNVTNGKYTLKYKAYQTSIFSLVEVTLPSLELDEITLMVNNTQPDAELYMVKYDPSSPQYDPGSDGEISECGIINLASDTENLRFVVKAWHEDGYLRLWRLDNLWGKNHHGGYIATDSYNPAGGVLWQGVDGGEYASEDATSLTPWQQCSYQFRIRCWARITNGFGYIYWDDFSDHYYINLAETCGRADINMNGTVNLEDFAILASHWLETCNGN